MRPRDLIEFFNNVVELAAGRTTLTKEMVLEGEGIYSKNRMRSLQDEWISDYPSLIDCSTLLKQRPNTFKLSAIPQEQVEDFCLAFSISTANQMRPDLLASQAYAVVDGVISWESFLRTLMHVFYITGIVGLKTEAYESFQWSHQGPSTIVADTIGMETSATIHPMFYRVLGVKPSRD